MFINYEKEQDIKNQREVALFVKRKIGFEWLAERRDHKTFDFLAIISGRPATLEVKCPRQSYFAFPTTFTSQVKVLCARALPPEWLALFAARYAGEMILVWDLRNCDVSNTQEQPRKDRPEKETVVLLKKSDAIHQWPLI